MKTWQDRFRVIVSVYLVLIDDRDQVLLLKRQNTGFKDGEYGLPAGHVDGGEEMRVAMCREAKEEVALDLDPASLTLAHTMHRNCGDHERVDFFFTCRTWNGTPSNAEPEKCSELVWAPLVDSPPNVIDYYRQMFEQIQKGESYSSFGWDAEGSG